MSRCSAALAVILRQLECCNTSKYFFKYSNKWLLFPFGRCLARRCLHNVGWGNAGLCRNKSCCRDRWVVHSSTKTMPPMPRLVHPVSLPWSLNLLRQPALCNYLGHPYQQWVKWSLREQINHSWPRAVARRLTRSSLKRNGEWKSTPTDSQVQIRNVEWHDQSLTRCQDCCRNRYVSFLVTLAPIRLSPP